MSSRRTLAALQSTLRLSIHQTNSSFRRPHAPLSIRLVNTTLSSRSKLTKMTIPPLYTTSSALALTPLDGGQAGRDGSFQVGRAAA